MREEGKSTGGGQEDVRGCRRVSGRGFGRFAGQTGRWSECGRAAGGRWRERRCWRRGLREDGRRGDGGEGGDGGDGGAPDRRRRRHKGGGGGLRMAASR